MLNLIKMDFDVYRSSFLWMLVYTILFAAVYSNTTFIGTISILCIYMVVFSAFAAEERDRIHLLHKTLPVSDKEIVGVKYVETAIVWVLGIVIGTAVMFIAQRVKGLTSVDYEMFNAEEYITMLLVLFPLSMIMASATIPLIYKFGYSKGRLVGMIVWIAIALGFSSIYYALDLPDMLTAHGLAYIASVIISAAAMTISFFVSVRIYRKK